MSTRKSINARKHVMTFAVLFTLVFMFSCTGEPQKPENIQGDGYAYTKEWITWYITNELIKKTKVPSVAVALVDDQEVVWQETFGFANLEEQIPATVDTIYRIGSVSKPFTALAIMKLYEEGLMDLDAPITDYLPGFSMQSRFPESDPITIRNLMSHRSGIPNTKRAMGEAHLESFERISLEEIVDSLKDDYVAYPVGYRFKYSNLGFVLLGRIIELVTGNEFAEYMQGNVLEPLGMVNSSFLSSPEIDAMIAMGYKIIEGEAESRPHIDFSELPGDNLYATLNDMNEFVKFLFNEGRVGSNQFIRNETLEMMYVDSFSRPRDPVPWGLPWELIHLSTNQLAVYHGGDMPGFSTYVGFLPDEKLGFVILTNYEFPPLTPLRKKTLELMLETKFGIKPIEQDIPEPVQVERTILEKYAGKYSAGAGVPPEILLKNNKLQAEFLNHFGRSEYNNPCPDCYDSSCP